jgi:hypothetical protein
MLALSELAIVQARVLCSNAIARQRSHDEIEFVVCASGANGFPIERKRSQCHFEESMIE